MTEPIHIHRRSPNVFSLGDVIDIGGYCATITKLTSSAVYTDDTTRWTWEQLTKLARGARCR